MPQGGIYRIDPPPQQPLPKVPIPAQGSPPPIGPTQLAIYGNVIRRAWEPPDPQPRQLPLTVAPLTLQYGTEPPRVSQPAPARSWWDTPNVPPQQYSAVAPLIPTVITFVPFTSPNQAVLSSWQTSSWTWTPPKYIAPLTLTYGQQPPRLVAQMPSASWWAVTYPQQEYAEVAPIVSVAPSVPFTAYPMAIVWQWQPPEPPRQRTQTAPIPAQGQQPPRYSPANQYAVVRMWDAPPPQPWQRLVTNPLASTATTATGEVTATATFASPGIGATFNAPGTDASVSMAGVTATFSSPGITVTFTF